MKIVYLVNSLFITVILSVISITVFAEGAKVTPLIQKTLNDLTNKEAIMINVEMPQGCLQTSIAMMLIFLSMY